MSQANIRKACENILCMKCSRGADMPEHRNRLAQGCDMYENHGKQCVCETAVAH